MRKPWIISILLFCGMQTALGQIRPGLFGGCGSERTTDLDGGLASSTSGDHCVTVELQAPQPVNNVSRSSPPSYFPDFRPTFSPQESFPTVIDTFTQIYLHISSKDCEIFRSKTLLLSAVDTTVITVDMDAKELRPLMEVCVRSTAIRDSIERFRALTFEYLIGEVGLGSDNTCNRSWA